MIQYKPIIMRRGNILVTGGAGFTGCASIINSFTDVHGDERTNFIGTINVVTESIAHRIARFLYASSVTVYGNIEKLQVQEDIPCCSIPYYGISKYAAERFVHASSGRTDILSRFNATSFRMFNAYGPRQSLTNPYQGVMVIFIGNALRGEPINIFGDGRQARDFVYIDDVVNAWIAAIDKHTKYDINKHDQPGE